MTRRISLMRSGEAFFSTFMELKPGLRKYVGFCPAVAENGGSMAKRVCGFCCRPRCQKSIHELPCDSTDMANFLATKSARELVVVAASGGDKPAAKRSRRDPTADLYSSGSRCLINLPPLSFHSFGPPTISA